MKKLVIINGTMGIGKADVCHHLYKTTSDCVWLDGDWCWKINPWVLNQDTMEMVEDNITALLSNFLKHDSVKYIFFSWAIHNEEIYNKVIENLPKEDFELYTITLTCTPEALESRMTFRNFSEQDIAKSLYRQSMYDTMSTEKLDTTTLTNYEIGNKIREMISK